MSEPGEESKEKPPQEGHEEEMAVETATGRATSKIRRLGLRREPQGGWPLDQLFVGVATLRVTRELFLLEHYPFAGPQRAWDLALWSGVTPQGSADSLERLNRLGLVTRLSPDGPYNAAWFRLDWRQSLMGPLARLFRAERAMVRRSGETDPRRGGAGPT